MYDLNKIDQELKNLVTEKRYNHILRVRDKALELAKIYNAPTEIVEVGALLHDIAKYFDDENAYSIIEEEYKHIFDNGFKINQVLHGFAAAAYAKKKFNITDELILDSLRYHTIGRENMTLIDKIVYLADAIEDGRNYPNVDLIRKESLINLDSAILLEINFKLEFLIKKNVIIHPNTILFRNNLIKKGE
ncbi:bis(5'-nucleosyl)-tetraphosphatase (symmetrical) YqeK [Streptobacillus felis]|uniref:bis(5'-nucleosyl)-tetraphosphatase (symmetrical) n=1 Tax=Streptobacillus felis TaxID=1384509 RepID=A0A7Z0T6L5_9FUSO|nr:bis(5'-nucleosyl)-tetraphosphatase (symmetrical) YqeK [Streptobacillus felis]NYV27336.1 HD domain-containing protein [Streptobacillus felis]